MEIYFMCCVILLTSLVEVDSEKKVANRGESVFLFGNVTTDIVYNDVNLYINGKRNNTLLVTWIFEKERITMVPKSNFSISMDTARNIWINNVDETYSGKYSLHNSWGPSIELIVLDSSQTKSEHPSHNYWHWIVGGLVIALVIVPVVCLYVAYTKKWGKKILPCHKRRHGKHPTPTDIEEGEKFVSFEKPQDQEEHVQYSSPLARVDALYAETKQLKAEKANVEKQRVEEEDMKFLLIKIMEDLDAKFKALKEEIANVEKRRVEEEDLKYLHMLRIMDDRFAEFETKNIKRATFQNNLDEEEETPRSPGTSTNDNESFERERKTDITQKNTKLNAILIDSGKEAMKVAKQLKMMYGKYDFQISRESNSTKTVTDSSPHLAINPTIKINGPRIGNLIFDGCPISYKNAG